MADKKKSGDRGQAEVQRRVDAEQEQGYVGSAPDPTPNENYTVAGVVQGEPTPETDADLAAEAQRAAGLGAASASHPEAK